MTKKYGQSCKVWHHAILFHQHRDAMDAARELLKRSLQSLPRRKHVKMILKFAQLEFKAGDSERGRTLFEGLVGNFPKRADLWSVYLDMEIQQGDAAVIRRLFERVTSLRLSSKKMKFFFKRYLEYEKTSGTEDTIDHVKQKARSYVEQLSRQV